MGRLEKAFDQQSILSSIPVGADPFGYLASVIKARFCLPFSKLTVGILVMLLVFHSLIMIFCLFILVMSYVSGAKQGRWVFRSLYIKDHAGENVYQSPLYFVNASILMAAFQLLGSAASESYIWIQLKMALWPDYAMHAQIMPSLSLMYIFENLTHWSMTHCFLVTVYVTRRFNRETETKGWISPPVLINIFFIGFPVGVAVVTSVLFAWVSATRDHLSFQVAEILDGLTQASAVWKQLQLRPDKEKGRIATHLMHIILKLKKDSGAMGAPLEELFTSFHCVQIVIFCFVCITCAVFTLMLCLLIQRYQRNDRRPRCCLISSTVDHMSHTDIKRRKSRKSHPILSAPTHPESVPGLLWNKQLLYLFLRAFGVILSMMTQLITLLIAIIKTDDVILDKFWRGVTTWLATVSGAWSAIPIAWQCWRLYTDQTTGGTPSSSLNTSLPASIPLSQPRSDPSVELEIKLPVSMPRIASRSSAYNPIP